MSSGEDTGQTIVWKPQEGPQIALLECPVFEIFFGGARGGGKTEGSIGDWLQHSATYGVNAIGIFVRRRYKQLAEVIARTKQIFPLLGAKFNEQRSEWRMANGARLKFVYLERDSDAEEYQGHSYTRVYVEEVTNFPNPGPINKLRATLRSAVGVPVGMRLTGNPGGPGHLWVKKRYIDPAPAGFKIIWEEAKITLDGVTRTVRLDRVFVPSKITDNRLIMENDPTYILRLRQSGSEQLVKAWLEGNWDIVDGAFFDCFDPFRHVLQTDTWLPRMPRTALRYRSMDWGSAKPFSVGWHILSDGTWGLPRGSILRFMEWYGAKADNVGLKMDAQSVARGILQRERDANIRCNYGVCDPSMFIRDGGPSIAEIMAQAGCTWRRADNKRVPGAELVRQRLIGDENGVPLLYFLDCCYDTLRTLPTLQHDENNPEDLDTDGEDHAYDDLRYGISSRPWEITQPKIPMCNLPKSVNQLTFNELLAKSMAKLKSMEKTSWR